MVFLPSAALFFCALSEGPENPEIPEIPEIPEVPDFPEIPDFPDYFLLKCSMRLVP